VIAKPPLLRQIEKLNDIFAGRQLAGFLISRKGRSGDLLNERPPKLESDAEG
jgi:hypothetical protein